MNVDGSVTFLPGDTAELLVPIRHQANITWVEATFINMLNQSQEIVLSGSLRNARVPAGGEPVDGKQSVAVLDAEIDHF